MRPRLRLDAASILATWFGAGLAPKAPGTAGSLAALPFAWMIAAGLGPLWLVLAAALLFPIGCWAAGRAARQAAAADPGWIVIDEVVGQWLTLAAAPLDPWNWGLGFVLFRLFDVWKPWPVSWADRKVGGGFGVMLDDVLAGLYAAAVLWIIRQLGGWDAR